MEQIITTENIVVGGRDCRLFAMERPECLLVQPTARHEAAGLGREAGLVATGSGRRFVMAAFDTAGWAAALMPWHDDNVSRDEAVGQGAGSTLAFVTGNLVPWLRRRYGMLPVVIGGYSLGALFSLWASSQSDAFYGVAAASPSVWIKGWTDFAAAHPLKAARAYMSLGDREEHARNKAMARVGDNIRLCHGLLAARMGGGTVLEWNRGGHFGDEAARTARAFAWVMERLP